jgi:hypothetical protein
MNNNTLTDLNIAKNAMTWGSSWGEMSGVVAISNAVPTMGALTSLNVSKNSLGGYYDFGKSKWISGMTGINALASAIAECK